MYIQKIKKRILAIILSLALVLPLSVSLCAPITAHAATSDLYGTGSADEINIIKLLDMALNRGGMSMSPATIRTFLEFWWSSVQEDLSACIGNVDTSITGTQAFISALGDIIDAPEHADKLGGILKKYLSFVATMEYETLSDFKTLLTQQDTFRKFLLSYVVDEEGNIAGTVNNKLKKYRLKSEFVNLTRKAAESYIEEYEGYYLVKTKSYKDLSPSYFSVKSSYEYLYNAAKSIPDGDIYGFMQNGYSDTFKYGISDFSGLNFVLKNGALAPDKMTSATQFISLSLYDNNWNIVCTQYPTPYYKISTINSWEINSSLPDYSDKSAWDSLSYGYFNYFILNPTFAKTYLYEGWLLTSDGRSIKVWKSLDAFKQYSIGKSNIYYTKDYSGYDMTADNTVGFTGSYYSSNSSSYSHDVIQNTIDNSSEVNESTINNIVNNYITNNNYGDGSGSGGSGGSGSGDSGNGWWNIGDGISSVIEGIASLLDFVLKLLGDLIGLLGSFLTSILDVLSSLTAVGQEFSDFITEAFKFIPEDLLTMMFTSIAIMCGIGIFKAFKK